jgi:hypothetical protein
MSLNLAIPLVVVLIVGVLYWLIAKRRRGSK